MVFDQTPFDFDQVRRACERRDMEKRITDRLSGRSLNYSLHTRRETSFSLLRKDLERMSDAADKMMWLEERAALRRRLILITFSPPLIASRSAQPR